MTSVYKKEFFAVTREEAVSMAATHFSVEVERIEVQEIGSDDFVGMGERRCFIASVEGTADQLPPDDRGPPRERRPRDEGRDRDRGRRDDRRGRGRNDRGDRGDRPRGGDRRGDRPRRPRGDKPEGVDHERFEAMAKEAADRVLATGQPELLPAMNSKERWVVHNYLKEVAGVTSVSEGEGASKQIKVLPE